MKNELEHYFLLCRKSYLTCINLPENREIVRELGPEVTFDDLELRNDSIKVKMDSGEYGESIIETRVHLHIKPSGKNVGYFSLICNLDGEPVDNYLVFR